ncbi:MAG: ATP-binding protein [Bacteroidetes bacterium]|nr:ATP-binding protein [Bacteroidota bacterium]
MIHRDVTEKLIHVAQKFPVITVTGPRQSGKTTLCRSIFADHAYVNLENLNHQNFALDDPLGFLSQFTEGAVIDEVQRAPKLLSFLQEIVDESQDPGRWILTGSHNLQLSSSISQSLAGRTAVIDLLPLTWREITQFSKHPQTLVEALFYGGYPRIFDKEIHPSDWLSNYVRTYIERDIRSMTNVGDLQRFQHFVQLCAGRTSQLLNLSSLGNDCGVSQPTIKSWVSILEASFIGFRLLSFHGNLRKRLVRMPKIHFYDSGLVCWLLGIQTPDQLRTHPLRGAIFETWVVSELLKNYTNRGETSRLLSYYRDHNGAEVDLIINDPPNHLTLLDAKSSQTISTSLLNGVNRVQKHFKESSYTCSSVIIHGGELHQIRKQVRLIPWRDIHSVFSDQK